MQIQSQNPNLNLEQENFALERNAPKDQEKTLLPIEF
jgi:hypothetical protein